MIWFIIENKRMYDNLGEFIIILTTEIFKILFYGDISEYIIKITLK